MKKSSTTMNAPAVRTASAGHGAPTGVWGWEEEISCMSPMVQRDGSRVDYPGGNRLACHRVALESAQRAQTPFELRTLDCVGAECDRPLVRKRGASGVARAAEQLGVRRVQWLVA